jgi:hypothetical protein
VYSGNHAHPLSGEYANLHLCGCVGNRKSGCMCYVAVWATLLDLRHQCGGSQANFSAGETALHRLLDSVSKVSLLVLYTMQMMLSVAENVGCARARVLFLCAALHPSYSPGQSDESFALGVVCLTVMGRGKGSN